MITAKSPVRLHNGESGLVQRFWDADTATGRRWWLVEWDNGLITVAPEDLLTDVEREEWGDALDGVPEADRCQSVHGEWTGRRCGMRKGHRTLLHRNCEISWDDDRAAH